MWSITHDIFITWRNNLHLLLSFYPLVLLACNGDGLASYVFCYKCMLRLWPVHRPCNRLIFFNAEINIKQHKGISLFFKDRGRKMN